MNKRENYLRAYTFRGPAWIPMNFSITEAAWKFYGTSELEKLVFRHRGLFPDYAGIGSVTFKPYRAKGAEFVDSWGCTWKTEQEGSTGSVIRHSLEKWEDFTDFTPADPERQNGWEDIDWEKIAENIKTDIREGNFIRTGLRHGYLFMTLMYIRGYENLLFDMADNEPKLMELIGMIEDFCREILSRYIKLGADMLGFPEDLGSQDRLMLSPELFRKFIKPVYKRLMGQATDADILVHMHSDGYIMDIIDDLIECGVNVINLQDLVNGIDRIEKDIKGRIAIDLDIDRQDITVHGSPKDVDDLIREEVMKLSSPEGGLSMIYGFYPGTPLENAEAVMTAMEKYSTYKK